MKIFAEDLGFPEAPVLLEDGSHLFTEMTPETGCITWISADGKARRQVAKTGRPNGLAPDGQGGYLVAETAQRALLKVDLEGRTEVVAAAGDGQPFLFLNDLAFAPNGDLYLTDSGIDMETFAPNGELNPDWESLDYDGRVYCVDPGSGGVVTVDRRLRFTNGIAFGPDRKMYVAETLTGEIYVYDWRDGKVVSARQSFGNVIDPERPCPICGPDGMKFAANGHLFVAVFGQGHIAEMDTAGHIVRRIDTRGSMPTNLHFGAEGKACIFVTEAETGSVQVFDVGVDGFPLYR